MLNLESQLDDLRNSSIFNLNLEVGYNLRVTIVPNKNRRPKLKIELVTTKSKEIDNMSLGLIKKYVTALEEIRKWRKGLLPDFPTI